MGRRPAVALLGFVHICAKRDEALDRTVHALGRDEVQCRVIKCGRCVYLGAERQAIVVCSRDRATQQSDGALALLIAGVHVAAEGVQRGWPCHVPRTPLEHCNASLSVRSIERRRHVDSKHRNIARRAPDAPSLLAITPSRTWHEGRRPRRRPRTPSSPSSAIVPCRASAGSSRRCAAGPRAAAMLRRVVSRQCLAEPCGSWRTGQKKPSRRKPSGVSRRRLSGVTTPSVTTHKLEPLKRRGAAGGSPLLAPISHRPADPFRLKRFILIPVGA